MNYELAKKLKDAGFPQMGDGFALIEDKHDPDEIMRMIPWCQYVYRAPELGLALYAPTLSELIEACEDKFVSLTYLHEDDWYAQGETGEREGGSGRVPEEAVANLWLELNQK